MFFARACRKRADRRRKLYVIAEFYGSAFEYLSSFGNFHVLYVRFSLASFVGKEVFLMKKVWSLSKQSIGFIIAAGALLLLGLLWTFYGSLHLLSAVTAALATCTFFVLRNRYITKEEQWENVGEERYKELFDHVNDAIVLVENSSSFRILDVNRAACDRLGYRREELLGMHASNIVDLNNTKEIYRMIGKDRDEFYETNCFSKSGERIPIEVNMQILKLRGEKVIVTIARDISERKKMDMRIRHMAYYDDVTGLPNRRLFREKLETVMEEAGKADTGVAVLYLDIDRFKLVNDSLGHDYGDMLLLQVAERFTRCVGDNDFVARTGGDEFAIYYFGLNSEDDVVPMTEKVSQALEKPFVFGEIQIHISASIGIFLADGKEADDADNVMKYADIALSSAKEKGKNNYQIFNDDMKCISFNKLTMEAELRKAILCNEFVLHFQPQLDISTGAIVGMEALIRWHHPDKGVVSPQDFIPIAEETGLIVPIGEWVIEEACRQNKQWQAEGFPKIPVSVNLSIRQFMQHNLKEKLKAILEKIKLDPEYLELEITESMTIETEFAARTLLELKELGVHISIDDFGTGYSSLYLLKKFPIDKLKIDRSFVRDIMTDPNDAAIVATIISMTRHLNLKVIAEGVENEEQLRFLQKNRCHHVQGFLFSPPVSAEKLKDLVLQHIHAAPAESLDINSL